MKIKLLSVFKRKSDNEKVAVPVREKEKQICGGYTTVSQWRVTGRDTRYMLHVVGTNDYHYMAKWERVALLAHNKKNLLTNNGRDWMHAQVYTNTATGTRGSGFIAVSSDATAPAAADTTLAGEIATSGFIRSGADAVTKTHTAGTNSTLIEHTFTASGTVTAIQKTALFNASTSGTMSHENTITSADVVSGDTLKVSWTVNLG